MLRCLSVHAWLCKLRGGGEVDAPLLSGYPGVTRCNMAKVLSLPESVWPSFLSLPMCMLRHLILLFLIMALA